MRRRSRDSWQIRYYALDLSGQLKRYEETVQGKLKDAQRVRRQRMHAADIGGHVPQSKTTLREYLENWLVERKDRLANYTHARYGLIARHQIIPRLGAVHLTKLSPALLRAFYVEIASTGATNGGSLSSTTCAQVHRLLHAMLKSAVREELLAYNPADRLDPPKPRKVAIRALDLAEFQRLVERIRAASGIDRFLLPTLLGGGCGLRRGEMLALRWDDLDFAAGRLTVARSLEAIRLAEVEPGEPKTRLAFKSPKSGKARSVAMPRFVIDALRQHLLEQKKKRLLLGPAYKDEDLVVCNADGSPWHPESFTPRFKSAVRSVGFPDVYYHVLRHTAVSVLLALGVNVKAVQEMAGHHSSAFTLDRYGHLTPTLQQEAAERFDEVFRRVAG